MMIKAHESKLFLSLFDNMVENNQKIKNMIQLKPLLFQSIPHKKINQELVNWYVDCFINSVAKINLNVSNIPNVFLTQDLWEKIIDFDPSNFNKVPRKNYSNSIINIGLKKLPNFVFMTILQEHEKEPFNDIKDYFITAVRYNFSLDFFFKYYGETSLSKLSVTEELVFKFLEVNPLLLEHIPKKYQTDEVCMFALKKNYLSYKYIPSPTMEMYLELCNLNFDMRASSKYYAEYTSDEDLQYSIMNYKKSEIIMSVL